MLEQDKKELDAIYSFNLVHSSGSCLRYELLFAFCSISDGSFFPPEFRFSPDVRSHLQNKSAKFLEHYESFSFKFSNKLLEIGFAINSYVNEEVIKELNQIIVFLAETMNAAEKLKKTTDIHMSFSYRSLAHSTAIQLSSPLELMKYLMREKRLVAASAERLQSKIAS